MDGSALPAAAAYPEHPVHLDLLVDVLRPHLVVDGLERFEGPAQLWFTGPFHPALEALHPVLGGAEVVPYSVTLISLRVSQAGCIARLASVTYCWVLSGCVDDRSPKPATSDAEDSWTESPSEEETPDDELQLEVTKNAFEGPTDECAGGCIDLMGSVGGSPVQGATLSVSLGDVFLTEMLTDEDGLAQLCFAPGELAVSDKTLEIFAEDRRGSIQTTLALDIRPFGWDVGRVRIPGAPDTAEFAPELTPAPGVVFSPASDSWYAFQVTSPHRLGDLLWFAGTEVHDPSLDKNTYRLGVATLQDGSFVGHDAPILESADWDAYSQNAPTVITTSEGYTMWFHGRAAAQDVPVVGRAFSDDGLIWTTDPDNPVYAPIGGRAAHPSVLDDGEGRVEMWTLGQEGIEYALSSDAGGSFTPFCGNPVLRMCKTPEVTWTGERYLATYACAEDGEDLAYRIHWVESFDGLRWVSAGQPILTPSGITWQSKSVANGQVHWTDGAIQLTYVGVGETGAEPRNGFGLAMVWARVSHGTLVLAP